MAHCRCNVCLGDYSIASFRRLKCGHCFCVSCIDRLLAQRTRDQRRAAQCPECRAPILPGEPQIMYLDITTAKSLPDVVAEGLGLMDDASLVVSVRNAERRLRAVAEHQREHHEDLAKLWDAIADFNERILPIFLKVKSQDTQIEVLLKQVEELEELRVKAELSVRLAGEVANLRADQTQQNRKLRDMQVQRDDARAELANCREHMQRARDEARTNEVTAQADIRKLKGFLQRNAEDRTSAKTKLLTMEQEKAALEQENADLRQQLRVQDLSIDEDTFIDLEDDEIFPSERVPSSPKAPRTSYSTAPRRTPAAKVWQEPSLLSTLDFEGMPRPGFGSSWQISNRGTKRKERADANPQRPFPLMLVQGRPTAAVQLGPKLSRRVKQR